MSLNLLANSAVQMLSIHDPECMGSGKARKNRASPDYIPEDFFLYISAQISVFLDKDVIQCRDLVKLLQFLNLKQSGNWAVELQECDLLDSTPLDISVHDHLLYS